MSLNESIVENAALEWFGELGYAVGYGPHLAPGEHAEGTLTPALSQGERESYGESVLVGRLREAIRRLNPANACGSPHPASPTGRGEEASARALHADRRETIKRYLQVRFERKMNP
jgi:hypothetical protein